MVSGIYIFDLDRHFFDFNGNDAHLAYLFLNFWSNSHNDFLDIDFVVKPVRCFWSHEKILLLVEVVAVQRSARALLFNCIDK